MLSIRIFAALSLFATSLITMSAASASPAPATTSPFPKGQLLVTQLPPSLTTGFDFEGIIALGNCSASLVQFEGAPDTDKAIMLTNGHCVESGMPRPGQVLVDRPSNRRVSILDPSADEIGTVRAERLLYATMTKTDMALYRLSATYAEIRQKYNTRPFTLSSQHPQVGTAIEVISGYWQRGYRCQIEFFPHSLEEGGYRQEDSIRYSRPGCEVIGGTSGSPVIAGGTRTVIGVNNTGNESGRRCTMNNPCEIDANGTVTYTQGFSYGQQTFWVYSCLNDARQIDLNKQGCLLPKP